MDNRILVFIIFIVILYFLINKVNTFAMGGQYKMWHNRHPFYFHHYYRLKPHYYHKYHHIDDPYFMNSQYHKYHYYDYPHDSRHFKEHFNRFRRKHYNYRLGRYY